MQGKKKKGARQGTIRRIIMKKKKGEESKVQKSKAKKKGERRKAKAEKARRKET